MKFSHMLSLFGLLVAVTVGQSDLAAAQDRSILPRDEVPFAIHKIAASATQLPDQTLASVVGSGACVVGCVNIGLNLAVLTQLNTAVLTNVVGIGRNISQRASAIQGNAGIIGQGIGR